MVWPLFSFVNHLTQKQGGSNSRKHCTDGVSVQLFLKHLGSQLFPRVGWQIATSQWMYSWSKTEKKHIFENMLQQKVSMK